MPPGMPLPHIHWAGNVKYTSCSFLHAEFIIEKGGIFDPGCGQKS